MKLVIDASEVAEDLSECKPGDQKVVTITVGENDGKTITGEATEVEHLTGEEEYKDEEDGDEMEDQHMGAKMGMKGMKKMPKAILIVAGK